MTPAVDFGRHFRTAREALFDLLSDCAWHSCKELEAAAGNRYTARLLELRRLGYQIDTSDPAPGKDYRLVSLVPGEPQVKQARLYLDEADLQWLVEGVVTPAARRHAHDALASFRTNRSKL